MAAATAESDPIVGRTLDLLFSESVRRYPIRPALFISGRAWSYSELDVECSKIERAIGSAGLTRKRCNIGLAYARGMFSYAAIIAIMRSGNVYVPLSEKLPTQRLIEIIEDACIDALIIDTSDAPSEGLTEFLQHRHSRALQIIAPDSDSSCDSTIAVAPQHRLRRVSHGQFDNLHTERAEDTSSDCTHLAYIIYTSGSTGAPKGVSITHESAYRCIEKSHRLFETNEKDRFTQFSALSFDVSILDLFLCWKSGACLYVPAHSESIVPLKFVVIHEITVWSSVPSLANFLLKLQLLKNNALSHVRLFLFCGEALPIELARALVVAAPQARIINLYGPTECTIFATYHEFDKERSPPHGVVPIGHPLPGLRCIIVADGRRIQEDDVPGELWLSGDQLAVGYWNNSSATEAAFLKHLGAEALQDTWYRTGDLVSRSSGDGLSFRGRVDRQVKLLGHRVELGEVECVLREKFGCALVAVVPVYSGGICERIVAYCDKLHADERTIRDECLTHLPRYKAPARIIELPEFPITSNGKIDYLTLTAHAKSLKP